jgi:Transposase family tnp2
MQTMGNTMSPVDKEFLRTFPADIRTARKLLGGPKTITYACCPSCNSLYPPRHDDGVVIYPYICTSEPCQLRGGCKLLKVGSTPDGKGKSIGVPQRPFVMQDFQDFVARLLSRPGVEAAIRRSGERVREETVEDIITADGVRAIKGPDDAPFLSSGQPDELRLLWCLSVDFFNPYHNKIAGKVASVGSIVLSCLLLPPDIRHKPENLCLVGIIPGPREPSGEEIDHFLRPLVEAMKESWAHGAIYGTHDYPHGRLVRSAIALSVNDLPMARKIMGTANYIDRNVAKEANLDLWRVRTLQKVQEDADKWQRATSQKERKRLYGKTGVRHSVLMELEYWNPTTMVPVDCMHLFFIGLLQYHARTVLGMDSAGTRNEKDTKTIERLEDARKMLLGASPQSLDLRALTVDVLKTLCEERGIGVARSGGARKEDLIALLKV